MRTYQQTRGHQPDFIVEYHIYGPESGGRKVTYQYLRCDFMYEGDDPSEDGIFMIHPEFLDANGAPLDEGHAVPLDGQASMWILVPSMRALHSSRIKLGVKGYFMEGPRKVGTVEVTKIVGLHENPAA